MVAWGKNCGLPKRDGHAYPRQCYVVVLASCTLNSSAINQEIKAGQKVQVLTPQLRALLHFRESIHAAAGVVGRKAC